MKLIPTSNPYTKVLLRNSASGTPGIPSAKGYANVIETPRHKGAFSRAPYPSYHWTWVSPVNAMAPVIPAGMTLQVLDSQTLSSFIYLFIHFLRHENSVMKTKPLGSELVSPETPQSCLLRSCNLLHHSQGLEPNCPRWLDLHTNSLHCLKNLSPKPSLSPAPSKHNLFSDLLLTFKKADRPLTSGCL